MSSPSSAPTTDQILPILSPLVLRDIHLIIVHSAVYGTYLVLLVAALLGLLRKRRRSATIVAALLLAMFSIATVLWAIGIAVLSRRFSTVFGSSDGTILTRLASADASTLKIRYLADIMFTLLYLLGDAVMIWRVLKLRAWTRWLSALTITLWLGSFGSVN
ncbi:hypothetical protein EXIGLDRAFT_780424 [Exidia glandulosa HHB12029]|uniref:Uncharacterized protein n=1 Tax=Exidia glandulosa HHB12029 TaxID=1314781 RepID=A0A165BLY6_EXIGL|nr:hypothetical protein EXIGLDRAFT_780424 [Exidia glandulosa HHB12029]